MLLRFCLLLTLVGSEFSPAVAAAAVDLFLLLFFLIFPPPVMRALYFFLGLDLLFLLPVDRRCPAASHNVTCVEDEIDENIAE